ncbi:hypothetical protein BDZ89DRAFT_1057053 [Hymenopellis radicata]|nr:hypothetical protein BDZ89DRAFT_1057053 [Hymenopellis radicata]
MATAPAWFAPVQAQLNRIEDTLAKLTNANNGNGHTYSFIIVNFNDNAPAISRLPALLNVAAIANLTYAQVNAYCQGYGIPMGTTSYMERKIGIARHIGCRDLGAFM